MKKNILMISGDSGIARGKRNIFYEMLKEFSKYFENVHVITGSNGIGKTFTIHGNVHIHPNNRSRFLRMDFWGHENFVYKRALKINKTDGLDFVISHVIPPVFPGTKAGIRVAKELGIPHFAEVMHIPGFPKAEGIRELIDRAAMGLFMKRYFAEFDKIRIINQGETRDFLLKSGVPAGKLIFIPAFYVDFELFKPQGNIKRNERAFVYSGRFETNKNIFALLDAFKIVSKSFPSAKLKMIGDGALLDRVKKFIIKYKMDGVEILGWLPGHEDLAKVYCESACLVMPSFSEGGPRVTLEAMACETAVISTPVGIMKEVIRDGENCLQTGWSAAEIAEKMMFVLKEPDKTRAIAKAGQRSVKEFEYHKAIKFYAESYLNLHVARRRRVMKKLFYILPEYEKNTSTHFGYNVELLDEIAKETDVFLFIEKGERPEYSRIQKIYVGKFRFILFRILERFFVFGAARLCGYRDFYSHYAYLSASIAGLICRLSFGRLWFWHCEMRGEYETKGCNLCGLGDKITKDWPFRFVLRACNTLMTCSKEMKKYYASAFHVPQEKIKVLPNWVDTKKLMPRKRKPGNTVLFLHWLSPRKGSRILPEIFEAARGAKFIVAGEGPDFSFLKDEFKRRKLKVDMVGAVANKDISDLFQKADVFVNPSREEEFGRVMIEAMAAGLPIVATKTLGAKAILSKKQSAFTFDYENPREGGNLISKILSSTKLRKELKEEGLSRVQVFDKDRIVEGFKKLF